MCSNIFGFNKNEEPECLLFYKNDAKLRLTIIYTRIRVICKLFIIQLGILYPFVYLC